MVFPGAPKVAMPTMLCTSTAEMSTKEKRVSVNRVVCCCICVSLHTLRERSESKLW